MIKTVIASTILVAILSLVIFYICREKRKGTACIGCPCAGNCKKCGGRS